MTRAICIHGHFYQPPRENPWLETIEQQDSARPHHDWNERVAAECYEPNATARILDSENFIIDIVNNYARISFDFGPTVLAWLERADPTVYRAILEADRQSRERFSGHGSAVAQAYNHSILPLANSRDKRTQAIWGVRDFERRFGRPPEGMWLPETAVDLESLEVLSDCGIKFTILAPHQAARVRAFGEKSWRELDGSDVDTRKPYVQRLSGGRSIAIFFYDDAASRAVAFERLLDRGENLASRLLAGFGPDDREDQLVHIATDGESYGHHHRRGEMALAYALRVIEERPDATLTNYGEWLEKHPPRDEVRIRENTSWSCVHGVERWRSDCGCNSGGRPDWGQHWRAPLREALDALRDELADAFEREGKASFEDPWAARDAYIDVILNRDEDSVDRFLAKAAARELDGEERVRALKLLEAQRHAMLMYTSCGWFFDEISGIETVQTIAYAGRAVQLAGELFGDRSEERFLDRLEKARSNLPDMGDGRKIYERFVRPAAIDLKRVGAHFAVSSLFDPVDSRQRIHCYEVRSEDLQIFETGQAKLVLGHGPILSRITGESNRFSFGAVYFGSQHINAGIREFRSEEEYRRMIDETIDAFNRADLIEVIRALDRNFGDSTYSLQSLFRDQQRAIIGRVLEPTVAEAADAQVQLYERQAALLRTLADLNVPPPRPLQHAAESALNQGLEDLLQTTELDAERIHLLLDRAREGRIRLDDQQLGHVFEETLTRLAGDLHAAPESLEPLRRLDGAADLQRDLPFDVNLGKVQNIYFSIHKDVHPGMRERAREGDSAAGDWVGTFESLAAKLHVRVK
jgi:alpha-amylase/alpha-mannosidase (GH57 family)